MRALDGDAVRAAGTAVRELLDGVPDGDAEVPVMGSTVTAVGQHVATCLAWYAHDLAAGAQETSPADLVPLPEASLAVVGRTVGAWGEVLARTVDGAAPEDQGWHSHGVADAAGFAAIGCAELLVHGTDVADALGLDWSPPADVAAGVLGRLFPEVTGVEDPIVGLLWATGRGDLPGRERRAGWTYAMVPSDD
ncbi:hypothetical protein [Candidatus Blastococcus massiliensis]|uniref:hypothetical protein n=1 Tax=Candidatus Blastococcus massiliensis TaxID=1470358 RepID=UPI0004ADA9BC|nr:hypothetical protein [Candidatus Blastococcus massiliensis]